MKEIDNLLKRLAAATLDAEIDLDNVEPKLRPGWGMRKGAAQDEVKQLNNRYKELLGQLITHKVFLVGTQAQTSKFLNNLAELNLDGLVVDAAALYKRITDRISHIVGMNGEFGVTQFNLQNNVVSEIAMENRDMVVAYPAAEGSPLIKSEEQLLQHVRTCFRKSNSDTINGGIVNKRIVKQALSLSWSTPTALYIKGVIDTNEIEGLSQSIIGQNAVVVRLVANPSVEWSEKILKQNNVIPSKTKKEE